MKFRYARHTNNLDLLTKFYTQIIGLQNLGGFEDHDGYNGVFLGKKNLDWHLEFTESQETVEHFPDEEDLIVFYIDSKKELEQILENAKSQGLTSISSKNPYWKKFGTEIKDPDGFGVILTLNNNGL